MIIKQYISVLTAASALAVALQAPSASAVAPCTPTIPTPLSGINCGPAAGPRANGNAFYTNGDIKVTYSINLASGISSASLPVLDDGQSQTPKSGGGFCPGVTDQTVNSQKVETSCTMAFVRAAKRLRITVG
jgi:hypothetical protein